MKARPQMTPVRIVLLLIFIAGVVALALGSSSVQLVGLIVALMALAVGVGSGFSSIFIADSGITPGGKTVPGTSETPVGPTDYVVANPEPTEADWEREREAYRAKQSHAGSHEQHDAGADEQRDARSDDG